MIDETVLLSDYPAEVAVTAEQVAAAIDHDTSILVVLDDDPTGTQSVADLPVLTAWETDDFRWAFGLDARAVYVLTNTRSLDPDAAAAVNRQVVAAASEVAAEVARRVVFVSRGDSTLRGHFPLETDVIAEASAPDAVVMVPAFPDAGRITVGGVHYMRQDDGLMPVAETEFAGDASFGYAHSDLAEWVEEKSAGRWRASQVVRLELGILRSGPEAVADLLRPLEGGVPVIVDIVTENDLRLLALGLDLVEGSGRSMLYRVGPPFVRARIGQDIREPLTAGEVFGTGPSPSSSGGLIVVGSHVGLTSRQLDRLTARGAVEATLELDIAQVLDDDAAEAHLDGLVGAALEALAVGDVVIHTSRVLRRTDDAEESLDISRRVSAAVVTVVQRILADTSPRFVIAKGGITSSDVASKGLGIRHAIVRGPMLPGLVSLWNPVGGPADGIPFIVFAGNVGDDESLADVVATLTSSRSSSRTQAPAPVESSIR